MHTNTVQNTADSLIKLQADEMLHINVIIIMYIYCMLINTLSAHIVHINLNIIFYTHVEHSPIKNNLHKVLYGNTHTHIHTQKMNLNVHDTDQYHTSYMRTCAHTHTHTHTHSH